MILAEIDARPTQFHRAPGFGPLGKTNTSARHWLHAPRTLSLQTKHHVYPNAITAVEELQFFVYNIVDSQTYRVLVQTGIVPV